MFEFRWKCSGKPLKICSGKGHSLAHVYRGSQFGEEQVWNGEQAK